jgi:hypothetical protein
LIKSFVRPVRRMHPESSIQAKSPLRNQPSVVNAAA